MISHANNHSCVLLYSASHNLARPCLFKALVKAVVVLILFSVALVTAQAQSCPNIPSGGGESISASISINSTGELLSDQGMVPAGTVVRIDAVATAFGDCTGMACCCVPTGAVYTVLSQPFKLHRG